MGLYTKKAITEAFVSLLNERPFDRISVVDIVGRCGLSRNTFYYYYDDVYALVDELFRSETQKIIDEDVHFSSWEEGFMHATRFARSNKKAIYHLYNSAGRPRLEQYLYDVILRDMVAAVRHQAEGLAAGEDVIQDIAVFYASALIGLETAWLRDGMKTDPEAYIARMGGLLSGNIRLALVRSDPRNAAGCAPDGAR